MTVGEARGLYSSQLKNYNMQKFSLAQQRQELKEKMESTEDGSEVFAEEAATLELRYNAVKEKQDEYQNYMDQLMEQWSMKLDAVAAKQQADSASEYGQELGKLITVARRIMHGDIVPQTDEKKLMEFDSDLYQMAKSIGAMAKLREKKKYDSLWDDEETSETEDAMEAADSQEAFSSGPKIVSVEDTMAAATETGDGE